jgi:glutamine synthetase adenylyltransferase
VRTSPWITELISHLSVLLDELIDRSALYTLPERADAGRRGAQHMLRIPLG